MGKVEVNGDKADPLFNWLKAEKPGLLGMKRVKWNFEKWLVGKDGKVVGRWASTTKPEALEKSILEQLGEGKAEAKEEARAPEPAAGEAAKTDV
jgi:glutathione peroxidase-family protein